MKNKTLRERKPSEKQYVYVIAHKIKNLYGPPIKVGVSVQPYLRAKELQVANPFQIALFEKMVFESRDDAEEMERDFHQIAEEYWIRGEWFNLDPRVAVVLLKTLLWAEYAHLNGALFKEKVRQYFPQRA